MEQIDAQRNAHRMAMQMQSGRTFAGGVAAFSPEAEERIMSVPVCTQYRQPLQIAATGAFKFMLGIDATGPSTGTGTAPGTSG